MTGAAPPVGRLLHSMEEWGRLHFSLDRERRESFALPAARRWGDPTTMASRPTATPLNCIYCRRDMTPPGLPVGPAEPWSATGRGGGDDDGGVCCTCRMCARRFRFTLKQRYFPLVLVCVCVFFFSRFSFSQNNFIVTRSPTCTKSDAVMSYSCNAQR